ncbi:MAG: DUF1841 family protein [Pseudomonadota bacterium]|nr:DUF1841 family protein [Pseudomonadota bacterium]
MRRYFLEAWRKARAGEPLDPLEQQLAVVIREHPEYHALLEDPDAAVGREFPPEGGQGNPFLHLSLHIAILEQVSTDRPAGVRALYQTLVGRFGSPHEAEHEVMECLAESLWEAQRAGQPPDEKAYLEHIRRLAGTGRSRP